MVVRRVGLVEAEMTQTIIAVATTATNPISAAAMFSMLASVFSSSAFNRAATSPCSFSTSA
ncbi:hypothetical protein [Mycobacteroides franklinii]|uniref:Uncharacterized protein n=1 Tax=Mycobacteroides franklinii TaxID=948102 RepID=A0A4R5PFY4_9MYCO|nr:hypothetical protein [Mycobacteroides franklinii]ORA56363.1 hypothetical protein BST24_25175 [Mycobacteroides franklinii]TDH25290.1 hypothetical protein EJ571_01370 [Mycobacteroides franklinii]